MYIYIYTYFFNFVYTEDEEFKMIFGNQFSCHKFRDIGCLMGFYILIGPPFCVPCDPMVWDPINIYIFPLHYQLTGKTGWLSIAAMRLLLVG